MASQALPVPANQLFRYLFEQASLGIAVEDLEGKILLANPALCSILGYTEQELRTMSCSEFANPEDSQDDWALFQQLRAGVIDHYSLEKRYIKKGGARIWGRLNVSLWKEGDGSSPLVFAFVEEITERKFADQELIRSNERFRLAVEASKSVGWEWDLKTGRDSWFGDLQTMFGIPSDAFVGRAEDFYGYVHPDDRQMVAKAVADARQTRKPYAAEFRVVRRDGMLHWVFATGNFYYGTGGDAERMLGMATDITERKRAEEALRQKDKELAEAQRLAGMGSWVWDAGTDEVTWSKEIYLRIGRDPGLPAPRFSGHANLFTAESWDRLQRAAEKALQTGTPYELDLEVVSPGSTARWIIGRGEPVRDAGGQIIGLRGTAQDITERKRAQEALRESEQRLRLAIQAGRMYAFDWNVATDVIVRSKESVEILNWEKPETDTGKAFHARIHPDDLAMYTAMEARLTPENPTYQMIFRALNPAGSVIWLEDSGRAFFDGQGSLIKVTGIVADITERKRVEEALKKSEEKFSKAFQQSPMALTLTSARDHRYIDVNETFERITGWRRDEVIGRTPFDIGIWVDSVRRLEFVKRVLAEGAVRNCEIHYRSKDGSQRVGLGAGELIQIANEPCILSVIADITERKQTEEALHESEERFRLAAQAGKMFAYEWDAATDKIVRSEGVWQILGVDAGPDTTGQELLKMVPPEDRARLIAAIAQLSPEEPHLRISYRMVRSDGSVIWIERTSRAYFDEHGKMLRMVGMIADITDRKLAEAALSNVSGKLIEAQEQERIRIGRELHDDIGQRLALLAVELGQLREHPLVLRRVRGRVGKLQKQVSEIARDTQSLSHELHSAKLQYLGLAGAMKGFCREFGEQQKAEIDFKAHDVPGHLSADISLCFFRVLQEALHNAVKHSGARHFEVRLWGTSDEMHLAIRDSGVGFDREAAKATQGLGLVSMEERLKLVNGTLSIESQPKRGATIHARAPLSWASASVRAAG